MKKILSLILCITLLCTAFSVALHAQETIPQGSLVVLGDSIGRGYRVEREYTYGYLLAQKLGFSLTNLARNGLRSDTVASELGTNTTMQQAVAGADVVVLSIGGVDFLSVYGDVLNGIVRYVAHGLWGNWNHMQQIWDTFEASLDSLVVQINTLNPDATIVVKTLFRTEVPVPATRRALHTIVNGFNDRIWAYYNQNPGAFLVADVATAFADRRGLMSHDLAHPSAAGHTIMATVISDTLHGTQTPLPPSHLGLDILAVVGFPVLLAADLILRFLVAPIMILWVVD